MNTQTFYFNYNSLWRRVERREMKTERLNFADCRIENAFSTVIISTSFYRRIWRLAHMCDANANANANGNASEFIRSTQTQGKRDTQAQEVFFQDGREWLGFCRFTRVGSKRKYKLKKMKMFYYTNYCVIQGFPALRKALTRHVKKMRYFFTCVLYR